MFKIGTRKEVKLIPSWKGALTKLREEGVALTEVVQALKLVELGSTCWVQGRSERFEVSEG